MTKLVGVSMVKDEMDILPYVIDHLVAEGVDGFVIADNMSTDGTWEYLQSLLKTPTWGDCPVIIKRDEEVGYYQSAKMNTLVNKAVNVFQPDEVIILPFDADELFYSLDPSITLSDALRGMGKGWTSATVIDHVPVSKEPYTGINPFIDFPYREPRIKARPSVAFSYEPGAHLAMGNHSVGHSGPEIPNVIGVRQLQYRSFEQYKRKLRNGKLAYDATDLPEDIGFHWRQGGAKSDEELLKDWIAFVEQDDLVYDPAPVRGLR